MKIRLISSLAFLTPFLTPLLTLGLAVMISAQDSNSTPSTGQVPAQGSGAGGGQGQRGGRSGGWGDFGDMGGRGIAGTVTEVAVDHYTVKTDAGESYVVHFSANTRILKQPVQKPGEGGPRGEGGERGDRQRSTPEAIKPGDIKTGDAVAAFGEIDSAAKSVGAVVVMLIDPERAKRMREQEANFGKTWLMGKVTAINETTVSLTGALDHAAHSFQADENTTFRKHREPVTLADVQVGDTIRVEGSVRNGSFFAASVTVMVMPQAGTPTVLRNAPTAPAPQTSAAQPK